MNPRNVGSLPQAEGIGEVMNPLCGDRIRFFLQIKKDRIQKATFETYGCRAAIATSSILTELVQNKTVDQALQITREDVAKVLGELPPLKQNCAKLGEFAVKAAVGDYLAKSRGDRTLTDQIFERLHDPQEWTPNI